MRGLAALAAVMALTSAYDEPPAYSYRVPNAGPSKPKPKTKRKFKGSKAAKKAHRKARA